jgi:hypothetical protein
MGMGLANRLGATLTATLLALTLTGGATASHNVQRGVSLHYKAKVFKGRIRSDPPVCLDGVVTLHKAKRGANLTLGSDPAASDGSWSISRTAKRGRFYATTPGYRTSSGTLCRSVRSPVLDLG